MKYCNYAEVMRQLECSLQTVYNYRDAGLLRQEPIGKRKYFVVEDVLALRQKRIDAGEIKVDAPASPQPQEVIAE